MCVTKKINSAKLLINQTKRNIFFE